MRNGDGKLKRILTGSWFHVKKKEKKKREIKTHLCLFHWSGDLLCFLTSDDMISFHEVWTVWRTVIHASVELIPNKASYSGVSFLQPFKNRTKLWLGKALELRPFLSSELNSALETTSQNNLQWRSLRCNNSNIERWGAQVPTYITSLCPHTLSLLQYYTTQVCAGPTTNLFCISNCIHCLQSSLLALLVLSASFVNFS